MLNLSSIGGLSAGALQSPYLTSKHAVLALTETLYLDVKTVGAPIQVSAVLPGAVRTQIYSGASASGLAGEALREQLDRYLGQGLTPEQAAESIFAQLAKGAFWIGTQPEVLEPSPHITRIISRSSPRRPPSSPSPNETVLVPRCVPGRRRPGPSIHPGQRTHIPRLDPDRPGFGCRRRRLRGIRLRDGWPHRSRHPGSWRVDWVNHAVCQCISSMDRGRTRFAVGAKPPSPYVRRHRRGACTGIRADVVDGRGDAVTPLQPTHADRGLQPERTTMAWVRTGTSLATAALIYLRYVPGPPVAIGILGGSTLIGAVGIIAISHRGTAADPTISGSAAASRGQHEIQRWCCWSPPWPSAPGSWCSPACESMMLHDQARRPERNFTKGAERRGQAPPTPESPNLQSSTVFEDVESAGGQAHRRSVAAGQTCELARCTDERWAGSCRPKGVCRQDPARSFTRAVATRVRSCCVPPATKSPG